PRERAGVPIVTAPNPFHWTAQFAGSQAMSGLSVSFPNERTHQWNLSIGRQFIGTAIDFGYVGTHSLNIPYSEDLNLLRPSTTPFSAARSPYPRYVGANLLQPG